LKTIVAKVRQQKLFEKGETVLVAVSGGADSVALLDVLVRLEHGLNLVVAHLNHGLRGDASDGDESFVSALAASHGLPFVVARVDVAGLAKSQRLSLEDSGRRARYSFFAETARVHGATSIALAHHLDDQAETVLMRLLRGAGGSGLSAMGNGGDGILKRPLLQISRREIERYLKERGLKHRVDASNADTAILRNSIRHELIPFLKRYNPCISERLALTAQILASDEEVLDDLTATVYRRLACAAPSGIVLDVGALRLEKRGLRLRLYRHALSELRGDLQRIGLSHLESIDRLATSSRPNASIDLPGRCLVARSYGKLSFKVPETAPDGGWEVSVEGEGGCQLPNGRRLLVRRIPRPAQLDPGSPWVAYLDPEGAPFPWVLRSFTPGDRFTPLGMNGMQKVKDLFINSKIPLAERRRVPLLVSSGRIVWVAGIRMGEEAKVTGATGQVLRVEIPDITPQSSCQ
jgi:tRNA(Ile)-lysidine synthase